MALNIGEIFVRLGANTTDFTRGMTTAKNSMSGLTNSVKTSSLSIVGGIGGIGLAAAGAAVAAVKSSMTFNKAMANIGTLIPGNQERLQELKKDIMDLSKEFGILPNAMAEGVYQTISAYGDSADTMRRTRLAAEFATAGVMSLTTATDLLSSVTMAYGDTSLKAMKRTANLAFIGAKGKVTPEQLASAMPMVVPVAAELGIKDDELFAAMGTLSGVSGATANVVATQLAALSRAFLNPTEDMKMVLSVLADRMIEQGKIAGPLVDRYKSITKQMDAMRLQYSQASMKDAPKFAKRLEELKKASLEAAGGLGKSIVSGLGLQGTLKALAEITGGNSSKMSDLLGRVEGYAAASQLAGAQSDRYKDALKEMNTEGLTPLTTALAEQTEGINKTGYQWDQFKTKAANTMIGLGDFLAPGFSAIMSLLDGLGGAVKRSWEIFGQGGPEMLKARQEVVMEFAPLLDWFKGLPETIRKAFAPTWTSIGDSASGGWATASGGFETFGKSVTDWFSGLWSKEGAGIGSLWDGIKTSASGGWESVRSGFSGFWTSITTFFKNTWTYSVAGMGSLWDGIKASAAGGWDSVRSGFSSLWTSVTGWFSSLWSDSVSGMGSLWTGIKNSAAGGWESVRSGFSGLWTSITTFFSNTWTYIANILNGEDGLWAKIRNSATNAWSVVWSGFNNLWTNIGNWFSQLASAGYAWGINLFQRFWEGLKSWVTGGISGGGGTTSFNPPKLAAGGIVNRPTLAMIGEAGPEAVIPLDRMGGGGNYITINVNGSGNPDSVADAIVQRLKLKGIRVV